MVDSNVPLMPVFGLNHHDHDNDDDVDGKDKLLRVPNSVGRRRRRIEEKEGETARCWTVCPKDGQMGINDKEMAEAWAM